MQGTDGWRVTQNTRQLLAILRSELLMETMYHRQLVFQYLFIFEMVIYSCYVFLRGYYCTAVIEITIVSYCCTRPGIDRAQ